MRALVGARPQADRKGCGAGQRLCMGRQAERAAPGGPCALSSTMPRLPGGRRIGMTDCIFCKIVAKAIPATVVHEDEDTLAFMDIGQVNPGHVLVALKEHAENMFALRDA